MHQLCVASLIALLLGTVALLPRATSWAADPLDRIGYIIVISQENWSFDGLYGLFPGANGIASAGSHHPAGGPRWSAVRNAAAVHRYPAATTWPRSAHSH